MFLSPHEVCKSDEKYDLLIVDEAHRLRRRKNLTQYGTFDENNRTMMARGMLGTYIYVCNDNLRKYLKKYI